MEDSHNEVDDLLKIGNRFKDLDLLGPLSTARLDWNDDMLKSKEGIELIALDIQGITILGKHVLPCLMTGVSKQAMAAMIVLAWNLISPRTKARIYPRVDPTATDTRKKYDELSSDVINRTGITCSIVWPSDPKECASAITYVCASLLRLFTKSSDSYMNAWTHIKGSFQKFYGYAFPISGLDPSKKCIDDISFWFRILPECKNGITGFLFVHEDIKADRGLRRTLFEQHLAYTGMHAYDLFLRAQTALETSAEEMVSAMTYCRVKEELRTILLILQDFVRNPVENRKRQTWKYARIYHTEFFAQIQTKNCLELVCILANIVKITGSQDAGNVLSIVQLQNLPTFLGEFCRNFAQAIVLHFKEQKKPGDTQ